MRVPCLVHWRLTLLFAALGPFVGGLIAGTGEALNTFARLVVLAYIFGVVPAALTGLLLQFVVGLLPKQDRANIWLQLLIAPALGFVITCWIFSDLEALAVHLALIGAQSAAICLLVGRLLRIGADSSSKPKPLSGSA